MARIVELLVGLLGISGRITTETFRHVQDSSITTETFKHVQDRSIATETFRHVQDGSKNY
jgi:hypothetical protein